jgi:DeoR/GlpR family transcriptional regulator of sugar metabolism
MIVQERRSLIISKFEQGGTITITELAGLFNVSEMTIRRDLTILENEGLLRRVHGGAVSGRGRSYEPPLIVRNQNSIRSKQLIGKRAAEWVKEGDCIALDVGSTTFEIAQCLLKRQNLTVITPSIHIANLLSNQVGIRTIITGGIIRLGEASLIGELAQKAFENLYVDKLFLAVGGINEKAGFTEYNWDDTLVKKAMIQSAKQVIVVSDSTKFGNVAFAHISSFREVHHLITDKMPPAGILVKLKESNVSFEVVD